MRWRILLAAFLVLFVFVSCDQQPVEPPDTQSELAQLGVYNEPALIYQYTWTWEDYDACGIDVVTGDLTCKVNYKFSEGTTE